MGITGIIIILFFGAIALIAPFVSPWPSPVLVNLAPRLSAPTWLLPIDPLGFTSVFPLQNYEFTNDANNWIYNETINGEGYTVVNNSHFNTGDDGWFAIPPTPPSSTITNMFYNPNQGAPSSIGGSGPGCYEIQYNDTSQILAYGFGDAALEYDFLFNESRFPMGFVSAHPARLFVSYKIQVIFESTIQELGNADAIFSVQMENSTGSSIVIYQRRYATTGVLSWSSRTREMSQANITELFTGTDTMTLRFNILFRNSQIEDTPRVIFRLDDLQVQIHANYADITANPTMNGQWSGTTGSNVSGPGSYMLSYQDNEPEIFYRGSTAWIQQNISWDILDRPEEAFLRYSYKVESDGDWGDAFLNIIQDCYVENTGHTEQILREDNIYNDVPWTPSPEKVWDAFMIQNTFVQRGILQIRFRITLTDPTPEDTPSIQVYIDDLNFEIKGNYYGHLGAGQYGEDLYAQLLWGSRIALVVGLTAAFISTFVGLIVGLIAGYFGGLIDEVLMRVTDFFLIIPGLPLMIVLAAILSPHWWNIVLVIALIGWTGTARLVRSQVLAERQRAYVEAARAIGASDLYIIFRHVLPNVTPLLFAQITLGVSSAILSEAGLSFLGLTHPDDVSWGRMLMQASQAGAYSAGAWWYVFFPGICIVLLALSFTLVGYAVDEILNPRLRIRRQ